MNHRMPELSRFYGIIIRMFFVDHPPAHFHAIYGECEAIVEISTAEIIGGFLPLGAQEFSQAVGCAASR